MKKNWTAEQMAKLQELWNDGVKVRDIPSALCMNISHQAVHQKVQSLRKKGFRFDNRYEGWPSCDYSLLEKKEPQ